MIYFDHNATTAVSEAVYSAMEPFLQSFYGNPSALYRLGRLARTAIDQAREQVAGLVNAEPWQVVFTSGGTEANHLALNLCRQLPAVAISAIEHPSVAAPVEVWSELGKAVFRLPVDSQGQIEAHASESIDIPTAGLASIMLANNETGVLQPVTELALAFHERGWLVHTDAVQAVGKIPVDFKALDVDALSLSGHKLHGPKGVGALIIKTPGDWQPMFYGGKQELGLRAGTENVPAIVGLGKACEQARLGLGHQIDLVTGLRALLEQRLSSAFQNVRIFSEQAMRLPNTVQFSLPGADGEWLQMCLDKVNIAVSSGSACASGGGMPSPVLTAMGVPEPLAKGSVRVSLGVDNTSQEIDRFIAELIKIIG